MPGRRLARAADRVGCDRDEVDAAAGRGDKRIGECDRDGRRTGDDPEADRIDERACDVTIVGHYCWTTRVHIIMRLRTTGPSGAVAACGTSTVMPSAASRVNGFCASLVTTGTDVSAGRNP